MRKVSELMPNQARTTETHSIPEHYIFDAVIGADELLWIYHELLSASSWTLTRSSTGAKAAALPFISFPGLHIETRGDIHLHFLSGYFRSIIFRIRERVQRHNGLILPEISSEFTSAQNLVFQN